MLHKHDSMDKALRCALFGVSGTSLSLRLRASDPRPGPQASWPLPFHTSLPASRPPHAMHDRTARLRALQRGGNGAPSSTSAPTLMRPAAPPAALPKFGGFSFPFGGGQKDSPDAPQQDTQQECDNEPQSSHAPLRDMRDQVSRASVSGVCFAMPACTVAGP